MTPRAERGQLPTPEPNGTQPDRKRFYLRIPPNWKDLMPDERHASALEMAREAQRQLGIRPSSRQTQQAWRDRAH